MIEDRRHILIEIIKNDGMCDVIDDCEGCPIHTYCYPPSMFEEDYYSNNIHSEGILAEAYRIAKEEFGADNLFDLLL